MATDRLLRGDMLREMPRLLGYAAAVVVVASCTLLAWPLRDLVADADLVMIYLIGVVIVAGLIEVGPALVTAVLAVAAFDFFFVDPRFTFAVHDLDYLITFGVMAALGGLISRLSSRLRGQARAELVAETERVRVSLLSSVSHDLRTPVGVILGAAGTLLDDEVVVEAAVRRELLATIRDEADRLGRLLHNLLEMTRIEGGGLRVDSQWHLPEELIGSALHRLESRLGTREIRVAVDESVGLVQMDGLLIEVVLINLVENALKYTPEGSPIEIRAHTSGGGLHIAVVDHGPGVPAEQRERIFEKFVRGEQAVGGTGLGLTICRAILAAHRGRIWVAENQGGGAVFELELPATAAPPVAPATLEQQTG